MNVNIQYANPMYDIVFKYAMEDNSIAKTVVSKITKEETVSLEPRPQESTTDNVDFVGKKGRMPWEQNTEADSVDYVDKKGEKTYYRLDYTAKIKDKQGNYKVILIEMQKSSDIDDVMRFRRYMGEQYVKRANTIEIPKGKGKEVHIVGMPIYGIFFLGRNIGIDKEAIIEVDCVARGAKTQTVYSNDLPFLKMMYHHSWVVQIDSLPEKPETDAERLLTLFDQRRATVDKHVLTICEEEVHEDLHPFLSRLQAAAGNETIRRKMIAQDELEATMNNMKVDGIIIGEARGEARGLEKGRAEGEAERALLQAEKDAAQAREAAAQAREAAAQAREAAAQAEKEAAQAGMRNMILSLSAAGMSTVQIAKCANIPEDDVERIISKENTVNNS
jgi:hypothetical protein